MTVQSPGLLAALLESDLDVSLQMQWAIRLATARKLDLLILQQVESPEEHIVEISLDETPQKGATNTIRQVVSIIQDSPTLHPGPRQSPEAGKEEGDRVPHTTHVSFKQIHFTNLRSLRRLLLHELRTSKVKFFTLSRKKLLDSSDVDLVRESRLFLRYLPCETVLCQGLEEGKAMSRFLVAAGSGPNDKAALQLGLDLTSQENGTLTALHVNPSVGVDSEQVGERRLDRILRKLLGGKHVAVNRRVIVNNHVNNGICQVCEEGNTDLIIVGATQPHIEGIIATKLGNEAPVAIVSSAYPFTNRFKEFLEESIQRFVPQIEREDRVALVDRLQSSAAWNFDFLTLIALSTIMAAIGLIQNSAAVVIGAMLVAPLMTPLLGLGLALVQGNPVLARLSFRSILLGVCVSLLGGFLVGLCTLTFVEPTREMFARGAPGLLDISVAFAAGLAAAYASSRPGLIAALPGVAIAAALVPPIATSGLALSLGDFSLAISALILFIINMVTIVAASMASLWVVGIRNLKKPSRWIEVVGSTVIVSVLILGVYLSLQPQEYELTKELPAGLMETVQESLGTDYQLDNVAVAYDELGVQLRVSVVGKIPASEELGTKVRTAASDQYDRPVRVRLLTSIEMNAGSVKSETSNKGEGK